MNRRPTGVVLAAIALGFVSLILLFFAAMTVVTVFVMRQGLTPAATVPGAMVPSAAMMMGFSAVIALVELAAAVWGGATVAGLLKMKPWARVSIMVLGGCVAAFSLLGALGMAAVPAILKATPNAMPPNANPAQLHVVFMAMTAFCLLVAGVGIWWLVYFALRSTGNAFELAGSASTTAATVSIERRARPVQSGPMTDFTIAQPIPPEERPAVEETTSDPHDPPAL
jgi:hypothetical protein